MMANSDEDGLNFTLAGLYRAISFPEGGEPDLDRMKVLFHDSANLTRITPEGVDYFTLESFQAMAMEMLDRGVYTAFFEVEIARSTQIFGSMAHVLSAYETRSSAQSAAYLSRGVNSIQLIRSGSVWRIHSLLWDEETSATPLALSRIFPDREHLK